MIGTGRASCSGGVPGTALSNGQPMSRPIQAEVSINDTRISDVATSSNGAGKRRAHYGIFTPGSKFARAFTHGPL